MDHAAAFGKKRKITGTVVPGFFYTMTSGTQEAGLAILSFPPRSSREEALSVYPELDLMTVLPPEPTAGPESAAIHLEEARTMEAMFTRLRKENCPHLLSPEETRIVPQAQGDGFDLLLKTPLVQPISGIHWTEALAFRMGAEVCRGLEALKKLGLECTVICQEGIFRDREGQFVLGDFRCFQPRSSSERPALFGLSLLLQELSGSHSPEMEKILEKCNPLDFEQGYAGPRELRLALEQMSGAKPVKKKRKLPWVPVGLAVAFAAAALLFALGMGHTHQWVAATCEEGEYCAECGETGAAALGHQWTPATCETPESCSVCGETRAAALGHQWLAATCETPECCQLCAETRASALGHLWQGATYLSRKYV